MTSYQECLERAESCAELAGEAASLPDKNRYRRMEAAWRALAREQQWLDGEITPHLDRTAEGVLSRRAIAEKV